MGSRAQMVNAITGSTTTAAAKTVGTMTGVLNVTRVPRQAVNFTCAIFEAPRQGSWPQSLNFLFW